MNGPCPLSPERKFGSLLANPVVYEAARTFSACLPWHLAPSPGAPFGQCLPPRKSSANREAGISCRLIPLSFMSILQ
jgi:hypothetical protein